MDVWIPVLIIIALFAFIFLLAGLGILWAVKQDKREKALKENLEHRGIAVSGQITKHRVEELSRGCHCYLTYQYVFEGKEYEYERRVSVEGFNSVRDEEKVEILLLPQDPSTSRIAPIDRFELKLL
jgi:hypothetical protein